MINSNLITFSNAKIIGKDLCRNCKDFNPILKEQLKLNCHNKKEGKDQESIQSSTTPDPGYQWESDNVTSRYHKREPRGQPFLSR